jgi:hypothetical protein
VENLCWNLRCECMLCGGRYPVTGPGLSVYEVLPVSVVTSLGKDRIMGCRSTLEKTSESWKEARKDAKCD